MAKGHGKLTSPKHYESKNIDHKDGHMRPHTQKSAEPPSPSFHHSIHKNHGGDIVPAKSSY